MRKNMNPDLSSDITTALQVLGNIGRSQPGFSIGIKTSRQDRFGAQEEVLFFARADQEYGTLPQIDDWACLRLAQLRKIIAINEVEPDELAELIDESCCSAATPKASSYALMHAAFSPAYTCFCEPMWLLSEFSGGQDKSRSDGLKIMSFEPQLPVLCQQIRALDPGIGTVILGMRGLLCGSDNLSGLLNLIEKFGSTRSENAEPVFSREADTEKTEDWIEMLRDLRPRVSAIRGRPLVLQLDASAAVQNYLDLPAGQLLVNRGLPFPDYYFYTGEPLWLDGEIEEGRVWPRESLAGTTIVIRPGLGAVAAGNSLAEARRSAEIFLSGTAAIAGSSTPASDEWPEEEEILSAAEWEGLTLPETHPYSGEIALVTGAASGIGKAAVKSLLERGSAVAGVDINPSIESTFDNPSYRGFVCDVANEQAVQRTIRDVLLWAGGLDMLILNAGLFPSGCDINKMNLAEFTRVIDVNFVSNLVLMREAHPLLSRAPRYGRVVMVGSRNMRAPGPGASAYSSSKAALTQLARVAALEWGPDRIRVNVIHPDSVFDTALYTEEVLAARSAHYGMTVEQYKKRNLLKVEITSHDVAEMIAEMCGPLFRNMTGAQIQFDGGNDRTL